MYDAAASWTLQDGSDKPSGTLIGNLASANAAIAYVLRAVQQLAQRCRHHRHWRRSLVAAVGVLAIIGIFCTHAFSARSDLAVPQRISGATTTTVTTTTSVTPGGRRSDPSKTSRSSSSSSSGNQQQRVHLVYTLHRPTGDLYDFDVSHVLTLLNITSASTDLAPAEQTPFVMHVLSTDADLVEITRRRFPEARTHHLQPEGLSARARRFLKTYLHQSVNPIEMERFRLLRWIVLADFFTGLAEDEAASGKGATDDNYEYILAVESDVAMFMPPQAMVHALGFRKWSTFESHEVVAGAMILWKRHGLESFANHIVDFYAQGEEEKDGKDAVANNVRQHGVLSANGCRREWSTVLPCPNATHMWHVSDVYVWRAWAAQNPYARTIQISSEFDKSGQTCDYIEHALCAEKVLFKRETGQGQHSRIVSLSYDSVAARLPSATATSPTTATSATHTRRDLCFIHFQGARGKQLIPEFYAFLSSSQSASGYAFVKTLCLY